MATVAYLTAVALLITAVASDTPAALQYTNHTVGGPAGWFFNITTNTSSTNFSAWAANQTFNLGDFLVFNTDTNVTVIETYNETTYRSCSTDDATDDDTFQYGGGSSEFGAPASIPVPLVKEGTTYYFSDADDGIQCQQGMAFEVVVGYGLGLPPSLNQPPPPLYATPPLPWDAPSPPVDVQPAGGGGLRVGANLRWVVSGLLFGGGFFLL